jgi:hypothetical protein
MKNFLAFVGAAILVTLGLGWYLEWYKIGRVSTGSGQSRVEIDINQAKIKADVEKGIKQGADKVSEVLDSRNGSNTGTTQPVAPANPAATKRDPKDDVLRDWFPDFGKPKQ